VASEWEGTLYSIERTDPELGELFATIFMAENGPLDRVPFAVIRQVCEGVNLPPDIFEVQH
jgi:hypothetical protein